jgi:hypothetical protein
MNNSIKLIVSPLEDFPGIFEAKVNDELIAKSRQPFLDSARKLIEAGSDPESTLTSRKYSNYVPQGIRHFSIKV